MRRQVFSEAPVIESARLILRPHQPTDFGPCATMWRDENVVRFIGGRPLSEEEAWSRLLRYAGHWLWLGFGYWALEEKATGRFVGEVGFADYQREMQPSLDGRPEIGWVLATEAHGKGYATEAAGAALAWNDAHLNGKPTVCIIHPDHKASIHVAEKLGFSILTTATYRSEAILLLERPRRG